MSEADAKVAASMVMRLGGMRMCEEGTEGGMTHLVLGSPRRTLKVQTRLLSRDLYCFVMAQVCLWWYGLPCAVCGYGIVWH